MKTLHEIIAQKRLIGRSFVSPGSDKAKNPFDWKNKCPYCDLRFESLVNLDYHVETLHNSRL